MRTRDHHLAQRSGGFLVVETAVALAIAGVVTAAVMALLAWSVTVQARTSLAADYQSALHQGADALAALIRQAGGGARPALGGGSTTSLILCGVQEESRTWRGRVQVTSDGSLAVLPLGGAVPAGCQGSDLQASRILVPGGYAATLQVRYYGLSSGSPASGCGGTGQPACSDVVAVAFTLSPKLPVGPNQAVLRVQPPPVQRLVTLRN